MAFCHRGAGVRPAKLGGCCRGIGDWELPPDPTGTNGNISADPMFVNRFAGDYHLRLRSPCIDTGDDSVVTPGETDLDGGPRIKHALVDMGCYEFPPAVKTVPTRGLPGGRGQDRG